MRHLEQRPWNPPGQLCPVWRLSASLVPALTAYALGGRGVVKAS